jgi:cytoskeletal protein RodZ
MKKILTVLASSVALLIATMFVVQSLTQSNQNQNTFLPSDNTSINSDSTSVNSATNNDDDDMKDSGTFISQQNDQSSQSQRSTLNLDAASLSQPNILSINSSATKLRGQIVVDGKVVKRLNKNSSEINLSPYLSMGQHKVEITARYSPPTSGVNVQINGPGTNVAQQNSGDGALNYKIDVNVK